ncbi:CubicO group peptidase (beta-lactamase class C family) [Roseimicrobium gellanilyticum]|uniref:CubicO group peptidase (Beta-lactamase class C family) n=1 Tax=Roseimicrobium gellanilyticum TaxID=748857 RepID=A0A366H8B7_9BACT|nr:serine hydrolase domain-containing protein [Roseimicrobium gellanilyticum]RBP37742.1 CubicO group peptidase (beta-lactamase class C family) [Roseimicrobium gellanilyticum]
MASTDIGNLKQALTDAFEANFCERGEIGASVSVFIEGEEVVHLSQGHTTRERTQPWTEDSMVPVWSATKGPAAVICLVAMEEAGISLESRVCEIWPEFAGGGKQDVTLRQLLSHTAGLSVLDEAVPMNDYALVIAAIEKQAPLFPPGTQQGYHARTFGFLLDEIVRRLTGASSLGAHFHERFRDPMGIDFWIGLPQELMSRVATLYPGKLRPELGKEPFFQAFNARGSVTSRTFASPAGLSAVQEMNRYESLAPGYASMGGVGSARGLASFYAMLAQGGEWRGRRYVSETVLSWLETTISQQEDAVLHAPIAFAAGVMKDAVDASGEKLRNIYGSGVRAFGHPGAGGSLAFADPGRKLSFAYVMNQMELGALPGERTLSLVRALG